jgi:hypothetical protein
MLLSLVVMALAGATAIVLTATATPAEAAGPCRCPLIYAPVTCDNGKTYPNLCEANCHHAKNCVPAGGV